MTLSKVFKTIVITACLSLLMQGTAFASGDDNGGEGWFDCAGVMYGESVRDNSGTCCLKSEMDCSGTCHGTKEVGCDGVCGSNKVFDACQVCDGPGEGPCGCGKTLNSYGCCGDLTNEGCGCGVACPKECYFVAAWANYSGHSGGYGGVGPENLNLIGSYKKYQNQITHRKAPPSCFHQEYGSKCPLNSTTPTIVRYGNCLGSGSYLGSYTAYDLAKFLKAPASVTNSLTSFYYGQVEMLMDESCNWVPWTPGKELCGFAGVSWSPISLVWDDSAPLEQGMTVVNFSLTTDQPNAFSLWKASDKAPLLVFDPYKTGNVSSAKQLFGNHAFGGVTTRLASFQSNETRAAWTNGFEALALLDRDKNGKVTGSELEGISLWFDKDRDAEVDSGELRDLQSEGVVALYYKNVQNVAGSQDVIAEVGYERMIDGKLVKGSSVDWYSEVFSTKMEAVTALAAIFKGNDGSHDHGVTSKTSLEDKHAMKWPVGNPMKFTPRVVKNHKENLSGFWVWQMDDEYGREHPGVFAFDDSGSEVVGFSVIESMLEKGAGHKSAVTILPTKGAMRTDSDGNRTLSFEVFDHKGLGKAVSVARLSNDGHTLIGTTTQTFESTRDGKTVSATVDYEWFARKFVQ